MKCWKKNLCRVNAHGKDTNCTRQRALPCKSARQRPTGARQSLLCLVLCLCRVPASIFFISFLFYLFQKLYWLFKYDQHTTSCKPTCGWKVRRVVVPPAHQSSNPRFDAVCCIKGGIFFQWEATFPSTASRPWWLRQSQDLIRRLRLSEVLIGVGCACMCAFIGVGAYTCVSVYDYTVFLKKKMLC